jgi:geranylgeranyl diphosphate synthase type I
LTAGAAQAFPSAPARSDPGRTVDGVLASTRRAVEPVMRAAVDTLPGSLRRAASYHFGWQDTDGAPVRVVGGKALRPSLVLLGAAVVGGNPDAALGAAAAVELVHNFSLVQDDVMDGDRVRRHRPTVWAVFGVGEAILLGDALLTLAFDLLAATAHPRADELGAMLRTAVQQLLEGQSADLALERRSEVNVAEYWDMARGKTAALLGASVALGALCGDGQPAQVRALKRFGADLGLAFQLVDDLLGIWGDPAVTGKPVRSDLANRKKSLPVLAALTAKGSPAGELARLYGIDRELSQAELARAADLIEAAGGRAVAQRRAEQLLSSSLARLDLGSWSPGPREDLVALARHLVHRDH